MPQRTRVIVYNTTKQPREFFLAVLPRLTDDFQKCRHYLSCYHRQSFISDLLNGTLSRRTYRIGQYVASVILKFRTKIKKEYYISVGINDAIGG